MDPLSVTASTIAIIQLTSEVISGTRDLYKTLKNAPKEVAELIDELAVFSDVLERLRDICQKADGPGISTALPTHANGATQKSLRLPTLSKMIKADGPLALCYERLLAFKERLINEDSKIKQSLKWSFRKEETVLLVKRLKNLRSILNDAIVSDHLALSVELQDSFVHLQGSLRTAATEDLSRRIFAWLSAPDPSSNFESAREKRSQGTGIWLLENPTFLRWKSSPCSLLWLSGKPGSGKTVLSSTAVDSLIPRGEVTACMSYFYFDFQINEKQQVRSFLKSIVAQLFDHNENTLRSAEQLYNTCSRGRTTPSIQSLKGVIRDILDRLPSVHIIIDALDECQDRESLLECFEDFCSWRQDNVHILATSRQEADIEDCFNMIASEKLSLEDGVVDEDIRRYVQYQLRHDKKLSRWSADVQLEIENALSEGAQGMFRWVECQLQAIRGCLKLVNLRKTLRSLPKSLDETYARMLEAIEEDYVEDVRRVLSCLIYSFHPLSIQEVADIVAISSSDETLYSVECRLSEPRDILRICSGFITTTRSVRTTHIGDRHLPIEELRLAHYSVQEYLVGGRILSPRTSLFILKERVTHELLATLCIRYLLWCHNEQFCEDHEFLSNYATQYLDIAAFAPYAAACWTRHVQAARLHETSPLHEESMKLLTCPSILRDIIRLHPPWFRYEETIILERLGYVKTTNGNHYIDSTFESVPPLYYASLLGMDQLVLTLLNQGANANCFTSEGTCLSVAACRGNLSTMQLLLAHGASIDTIVPQKTLKGEVCYSRTAIHEAVNGQHEESVKMLLEEGADVNIGRLHEGKFCWEVTLNTPLQTALIFGFKTLLSLLLHAGADPDAIGGVSGTGLEIVSRRGIDDIFVEMMAILLDAGANPNLTSDETGLRTPLFEGILTHNYKGVRLLIERGASPQSIDSRILPFIMRAHLATEEHFDWAVRVVMQLRPDLNMETPFIAACKYCHVETADYMLQHEVSANSRDSNGLPALHAASFTPGEGGAKLVEWLLDAGADINIHGQPFGSALQAAALTGRAESVNLLLEKGAILDSAEGVYGPALEIACNRLADQKAGVPETLTLGHRIEHYGPDGYFGGDNHSGYVNRLSSRKKLPTKDLGPSINIAHAESANYQAVIDVLLAHGARDALEATFKKTAV
ncbi:hypothetical protein ACLMJK_008002 [Lecanora helva]